MRLFLLLLVVLLVSPAHAGGGWLRTWFTKRRWTPLLPTCTGATPTNTGTVVLDGSLSEWDESETGADFFAALYKNGNPTGSPLARSYTRFECGDDETALGTLFVMVSAAPGVYLLEKNDVHFVKVDGTLRVDGEGVDADPVQFQFILDSSNRVVGWEAALPLTPGEVAVQVTTQIDMYTWRGVTATTGDKYAKCITIECDILDPITVGGLEGLVWEDCVPRDGILTATEVNDGTELAGIELFFCNGDSTGVTTVTDADGLWVLNNLDALTQPAGSQGFYVMVSLPDGESTFSPIPPPQGDGVRTTDASVMGRMPATGCVDPGADTLDAGACNPTLSGDPHFHGFLGQRFLMSGTTQHIYNIVSTPHVQYNARFVKTQYKYKGVYQTLINEMGILLGGSGARIRVFLDPEQLEEDRTMSVEVNGELVSWLNSETILLSEDGEEWIRRVPHKRREVIIQTNDLYFHVKGQMKKHPHLDDGLKLLNWDRPTHGLLGQTKDKSHLQNKGEDEVDADVTWPYFLDGSAADYDAGTEDIFAVNTRFNMFDGSE